MKSLARERRRAKKPQDITGKDTMPETKSLKDSRGEGPGPEMSTPAAPVRETISDRDRKETTRKPARAEPQADGQVVQARKSHRRADMPAADPRGGGGQNALD